MGTSAAYFDVDGTLVGTNLIHPTIVYLLNQATPMESIGRAGRALLNAPAMMMAELRDRRLFNEMLFYHYRGMTEDRILSVSRQAYESVVVPRIFLGSKELVAKCKEAGQRVVLITGSLNYTIEPLAEYLGADDIITNRLEMNDGVATGRLRRPVVAGPEKAALMVKDAQRHGHDLQECSGYSDSFSDVPMLSVVGHPACIKPDKRLARLARAYDWPILDIDRKPRGSSSFTRSGER